MEETEKRELQLLRQPPAAAATEAHKPSFFPSKPHIDPSPLDLTLSMALAPVSPTSVAALKQHAAEQTRLAAQEKARAERTREITRRELEMAEKDFARARLVWERAREDVEKVERMRLISTRRFSATCVEITCQSCRRSFQP
ncbi:hypothetical protein HPP92_009517 [Vanilla planifolia]|uniref:Uncharacterized protein n=1 Tax=Vanilla planifolia TaxID=51239 RepID=A0A835RFX4_VANPL|nr:hypothetical protein HPP92_009722 [Vanilla planifolia]KAG0487422.1 hypothetical protein HPP92_009517 [Vanilla planifolia]